ncbi:MAG: hypothetical protein HC828_12430 [Blastochloris sp.]|nr:hypothetical protein [Blastochloris sp.]
MEGESTDTRDARAAAGVGLSDPNAVRALQELLNLGPGRYYEEARQMLYDLYVAAGDAEAGRGEYCPAVVQYQNAVNIMSSGAAVSKRDNARNICAQATPTPDPLATMIPPLTPGGSPIAPIGQPGA